MRLVLLVSVLVLASLACSLTESNSTSDAPVVIVTATQAVVVQPSPSPTTQSSPTPTTQPASGGYVPPPSCAPRNDWATYIVVAGDTLSSIAQRSNTTTSALLQANCLANANVIRVGQPLRVPVQPVPPTQAPANSLPTVTENGVNVRTGPGVGYMAIGTLNRGARVQPRYRTDDGGWYLVVTDGIEGWVSAVYLSGLIPPQIPVYPGPIQPPLSDSILSDNTNVYTGPGLGYMIFGVVHKSTPVRATHRSEDGLWVLINSNIIEGWVWSGAINTNRDRLPVLPGPYQPPIDNS